MSARTFIGVGPGGLRRVTLNGDEVIAVQLFCQRTKHAFGDETELRSFLNSRTIPTKVKATVAAELKAKGYHSPSDSQLWKFVMHGTLPPNTKEQEEQALIGDGVMQCQAA